ncbi:uncharacterized protein LOC143211448 [Lasioglossum baleicum]|uniref:uncharacterized protein LOC143211448 n=1 Tax=Lasioglossum baleicum TaxID=434251 RepID=UPI003FCE41F7
MSNFINRYKSQPFGFANQDVGRSIRAEKHASRRKTVRGKTFNENRNILDSSLKEALTEKPKIPTAAETRMARLLRWKVDRDRRKKLEQAKKKRPFIVGKVHHKIYSPISKDEHATSIVASKTVCKSNKCVPPAPPKRITRATEKRLMLKAQLNKINNVPMKIDNSVKNKQPKLSKRQEESFAPEGYEFKPPKNLKRVPLFGRETNSINDSFNYTLTPFTRVSRVSRKSSVTNLPAQPINTILNTSYTIEKKQDDDNDCNTDEDSTESLVLRLSPNDQKLLNSSSRHSSRSRKNNDDSSNNVNKKDEESNKKLNDSQKEEEKEKQMKSSFNLNCTTNDSIPTKESVTKNVNISVEEEERTAQYFELLLNKEIERQSQLCEKWVKIKEEPGVTEDAHYQINQAIGQTNLLMNKKFVKFRNLVSDCTTGQGEMLVTCNDLQGFWDMMYIEVDDCNLRFQKLEQLRSRGWEEEQVIAIKKPRARKKEAATRKAVRTKSNGLGAFLAKRKQNMVEGTQNNNETKNPGIVNNEILSSKYENNENSPNCKFRVLRKLQLSDTKKLESPLTMIKISRMCKTPEVRLDDTIPYINLRQTPSRGILKQLKHSCTKLAHKVNFNDNVVSTNKDEIKNSAAVLTERDDLDFDCVGQETNAGRKLTFSDNSFEEPTNVFDDGRNSDSKKYANTNMCAQKTVPTTNIVSATPLQKSMLDCKSSTPSPSRKLTRQDAFDKDDESPPLNIVVSTPFKEVVDNTDSNESKQKLQKHVSVNKEQKTAEQHSDNIRILRNRSIIPGNTPTQKKRYSRKLSMNVQELEYKENKTPTKAKSKSLNKDNTLVQSEVDLHEAIRGMSLEEEHGRRRSSRRSVKFSEKECSGCVDKQTFSMTPHVRRSRAQSTEKKRSMATKESTDTTEKLPERVRRSRSRKA